MHAIEPVLGASSPTRSGCLCFTVASSAVAVICLMQYIALDYFIVRMRPYPAEANAYDWTMLFFPILPTALLIGAARTKSLRLDTSILIAALLLGFVLAVPLIATVGIWFHFAIGGTL